MNKIISKECRKILKELLHLCTQEQQLIFRKMYSQDDIELSINNVVDKLDDEKLDWAIEQCESTLEKNGINIVDTIASHKYTKDDLIEAFNAGKDKSSWCNMGGWHTKDKYEYFEDWFNKTND